MKKKIAKLILTFGLTVVLLVQQSSLALAATFTAGSAKRDAPGPFTAAPILQRDYAQSGSGDLINFSRGTQVSGNFYANIDTNQGSIVFWYTPEQSDPGAILFDITKFELDMFVNSTSVNFRIGGGTQVSKSVTWAAGTTYLIVARWDFDNTLDGTNYASVSVDDSHAFGYTSVSVDAPESTIEIGNRDSGTNVANGIIEGFTIYRRPLFDGTYGINVGNGDEINLIYNSGSGKDPTLVTGSWDVVFALPTNSSTGALSTGTGEAWSHPHASNLLYTSTTNTGGFMLNGTYTSDGWADEGTPSSVASLATSEKIFAGGYKITSDAANEGIYYDKTVTAGNDWVVRALANSDGTCTPKITLYDQTGSAEIGSLTGTTTSTRTAPNVFIFTGEAPASSTTLRVKLVNTAASGTCYWHQVEVLANLISNPSFDDGWSGADPNIPDDWTSSGFTAGETARETTTVHSGTASFKKNNAAHTDYLRQNSLNVTGFLMTGTWIYTSGVAEGYSYGPYVPFQYQLTDSGGGWGEVTTTNTSWTHLQAVYRDDNPFSGNEQFTVPFTNAGGSTTAYVDDVYAFQPTAVSLTVTPASEANSTENTDEIRVDGRDTYVQSSASSIGTTSGFVSFNWRPRHAAADGVKFAETTSDDAYIISFAGDSDDYIRVYWDSANTIRMSYSMAGTTGTSTWDATGAISANTEYSVSLTYTGGGSMVLSVGGSDRITLSSVPSAFGTAPNTVYFGSDTSSSNQGDATFSSIVFDNTAPSISLTALSPDPNNDTTPALTGTATEAIGTVSAVQFQMDGTGGSWSACTADDGTFDEASEAFTCTVASALSQGSHTMYVRATDSNGNTTGSGSESSDAFTIDSVAPSVSVTAYSPDPTTDTTPSVAGTATDATTALTAIQFQVDSTSGSWSACTADDGTVDETSEAFTCTTGALSDGSHTIYIRATDSASNTTALANYGSDGFTVDTTGPSVSLDSVSSTVADSTPSITGTVTDTSSVVSSIEYQADSTSGSWSACSPDDGAIDETSEDFTCTTGSLADGAHTVYVRATDGLSNVSSNASAAFTVDTASTAVELDSPGSDAYVNTAYPTYKWKKSSDSDISYYRLDTDVGKSTVYNIGGNISHSGSDTENSSYVIDYDGSYISVRNKDSARALAEGSHSFRVLAYDGVGNTGSASRDFTVDLTSPVLTSSLSDSLGEVEGYQVVSDITPGVIGTLTDTLYPQKVTFTFTKENYFLGVLTSTTTTLVETKTLQTSAKDTRLSFTYTPGTALNEGKYQLTVTGYDAAGNTDSSAYKVNLLSENKALELLRTQEDSEEEIAKLREKSQISIPGLEKQAKTRREMEAVNLQKFAEDAGGLITNIRDFAVGLARGGGGLLAGIFSQVGSLGGNAFVSLGTSLEKVRAHIASIDTSPLGRFLSSLTSPSFKRFDLELAGIQDGAKGTIRDSFESVSNTIARGTKAVSGFLSIASELTVRLGDLAGKSIDRSQEGMALEAREAYSGLDAVLGKVGLAAKLGARSLRRPAEETASFARKVAIVANTVHAVFFDPNPTRIENVYIEEVGSDYVVISWDTNHYTRNNKVNYGLDLKYGKSAWSGEYQKHHKVKIENLEPGTRYLFEVMSQNKNYAYDAYYGFETLKE